MKPIGVFDSGYGGLTVLKEIVKILPEYDYMYLGDNARAPYGSRTFQIVYQYTLQAVNWFFNHGCELVILACNTASAKALRTIQQNNLPIIAPNKRVLGVIRPTSEVIKNFTQTKHIGILATTGTVQSNSYVLEIEKFSPEIKIFQQACPMWVPLIENNEHLGKGADYFVKEYLNQLKKQSNKIDAVLPACTHYPLMLKKIKEYLPAGTKIIPQGEIVANSLKNYLQRHPEIETKCTKNKTLQFYTTDSPIDFNKKAGLFYGGEISSQHVSLS